jgi:hypothetical protein
MRGGDDKGEGMRSGEGWRGGGESEREYMVKQRGRSSAARFIWPCGADVTNQ